MPVKIKGTKALKASKENACVKHKQKINTGSKLGQRKVLGDKTNSASDASDSVLICETLPQKTVPIKNTVKVCDPINTETTERPRRARRFPTRFIENNDDKVVSKKPNTPSPVKTNIVSSKQIVPVIVTPLKTPLKTHDSSLVVNRTKRICRLPSKFNNSSTSPSKFLSVQPINSSTPLAPKAKTVKQAKRELRSKTVTEKKIQPKRNATKDSKKKNNVFQTTQKSPKQSQITSFLKKKLPDTNNNAKSNKNSLQASKKSLDKRVINNSKTERQKIKDLDFSIKISDDRKSLKRNSNKADIYEFTFDPSEEPPPAKKARKKNGTKKPSKPRKVTYKNNYEKNLAQALAALKNKVAPDKVMDQNDKKATNKVPSNKKTDLNEKITTGHKKTDLNEKVATGHKINEKNQILIEKNDKKQSINQDVETRDSENADKNYNSIRVEDIAMDIQPDADNNYSPANTPRPKTPKPNVPKTSNVNDPLNLHEDLSFFDDQPAASSSMNQSIRHPTASPWRIEFGNLPIKWQVNTYVKPNMTPALESSFINFNDSKKKHVYTPMVPVNDSIPEVIESPNLKQTSIISFIKEVVERSANKKRKKSSPVKNNSIFEDVTHSFVNIENTPAKEMVKTSKSVETPKQSVVIENIATDPNTNNDSSVEEKENESESIEKSNENEKNLTYFGFDESEDQENARPIRKKLRSTRSHNRRALQELNTFKGPIRPNLPVAAKTKILQNFENELYENMKSAMEPPVFPDIPIADNIEVTSVNQTDGNEEPQSIHLFEDIEVVHHQKPIRKSYSKPKRVMFRQKVVGSDHNNSDEENHKRSSEDEMDESFTLPTVQQKKPTKKRATKKQKLSKKEEKEVEAWAAGFNSMCEDIEEFDLVVE